MFNDAVKATGRLPLALFLPLAMAALAGLLGPNPLLTVAALALFVLLYVNFWRPGEPSVLFYALAYQWLQASVLIFRADFEGAPLDDFDLANIALQGSSLDFSLELATWLSLLGVAALAIGMRVGAGLGRRPALAAAAESMGAQLSTERLFRASLVALVLAQVVVGFSLLAGPLRQPLLALSNAHWVVIYLFTYSVVVQQRGAAKLALVIAIEVAIGWSGFFSDFKVVLIISMLAAVTVRRSLRGQRLLVVASIGAVTLASALVWTAVKNDYRSFSNAGSGEQQSVVSTEDRAAELARLVGNLTWEDMERATAQFLDRLSYVYLLAEVTRSVPSEIPYENGALWADAFYRAFVPRLLDSDKAVIDDSARTSEYTGLLIIGGDVGTSVSLGFVAESYIDFGPWLMAAPLLLWGWLVGLAYRKLIDSTPFPALGFATATVAIYLNASFLEMSNAKMVAGFVLTFVVLFLAQKYQGRRLVRWIAARPAAPTRAVPARQYPIAAAGREHDS